MPSYINDDTDLPFPKSNLRSMPANGDPDRYIRKDDWNDVCQALEDARTGLRDAKAIGFDPQASTPSLTGGSVYQLFVRDSDKALIYDNDGVLSALGSSSSVLSSTADGPTAIAFEVDTTTAWSNSTAKLVSLKNNSAEKLYVKYDGSIHSDVLTHTFSTITLDLGTGLLADGYVLTYNLGTTTWEGAAPAAGDNITGGGSTLTAASTGFDGQAGTTDGAGAKGFIFNTTNAFDPNTYPTNRLFSFQNNEIEFGYIRGDKDSYGYLELGAPTGVGIKLISRGDAGWAKIQMGLDDITVNSRYSFTGATSFNPVVDTGPSLGTGALRWLGLYSAGPLSGKFRTDSSASVTAAASDYIVACSNTSARTVALPAATAFIAGQMLVIFDSSGTAAGGESITINRAGSDTINGTTSFVINADYGTATLVSDGTSAWFVIAT